MKTQLEGRIAGDEWAVVLGVTGGTGGAVARSLARDAGLNVFGVHRGHYPDAALEVMRDVEAAGRSCRFLVAGAGTAEEAATDAAELAELVGKGRVRILVHAIANASYGCFIPRNGSITLEQKHFEKTFDGMAHSFVYWVQELYCRGLLADQAVLVALSNPMVDSVVHGWGMVAAAKAALEAYVRHLGHELGPKGFCVTLIKFGMVETRAIQVAFDDEEWRRVKSEITACTPAGRLATVDEVGRFVAYLAHGGGGWFNAATIDFTGGQTGALLDRIFNKEVSL